MSLSRSLEDKKYDVRMLEWNLRNGKITKEQYDQVLAALSDEGDKAMELNVFSDTEGTDIQ